MSRRRETNEVRKYIRRGKAKTKLSAKEFRRTERCKNVLYWLELRGLKYEDQKEEQNKAV